nr:protein DETOXIFICATION 16-like isoform X3 [Ziziphus jujuba var. spinosa]
MDVEEQKDFLVSKLLVPVPEENALQSRKRLSKDEIVAEVKKQLLLAGPLVFVNILIFSLQVISVMFVGHLGELALSGASLATSFASVTGFSLLIGMGSALDTFCGQSYGAKEYHMLGIHMQRAMIVLLLASIPLACIWANAGEILVSLGQDPKISAGAGRYARFMIPSIFAFAIIQCHARFLQTQNNVAPLMVTTGITTLSHIFTCWFLEHMDWVLQRGPLWTYKVSKTVCSLSCNDQVKFLKLSVPSAVMISLESWSFEMMVLLSGLLPNPELETSVLSISLNTCTMVYMIPLGISNAVSIRVSNELGAGRDKVALSAVCVALVMVVTEGIIAATTMTLGHRVWGYCYSSDARVVKYVGQMLLLISVSHFFDGIQSVLSGTIRGCGRQKIGACINLGAYYLMGIPVALLLAFFFHIGGKYDLQGLWIGITVALFVQAASLSVIIIRTDWEQEVKKAADRVFIKRISVDELS